MLGKKERVERLKDKSQVTGAKQRAGKLRCPPPRALPLAGTNH